jgi:hypothetical protein
MTGRTFKEGADCARLIAAAPELLATLDDILTSCTVIFPQHMAGEHSAALALVARLKGGDA